MQYVGIQAQQKSNNVRSMLLLVLFPVLVLALVLLFFFLLYIIGQSNDMNMGSTGQFVFPAFVASLPWTLGLVAIWFLIAYFSNTRIISRATGSKPLDRKDNKRVYNIVENLCMSQGMAMPKVNVIRDSSLNAFASGINEKSYTVTLTTGIIDKLDDDELAGVIAHELTHIRNRDVRLLIVSIVFVGIFAMIGQIALRVALSSSRSSRNSKNGGAIVMVLIVAVLAGVGFLFSSVMRFAISRNREYMADAGGAEMTRNPVALASALRKISSDCQVESIKRDDVAQLFIEHPLNKKKKTGKLSSIFATHPPIDKRISILEQF